MFKYCLPNFLYGTKFGGNLEGPLLIFRKEIWTKKTYCPDMSTFFQILTKKSQISRFGRDLAEVWSIQIFEYLNIWTDRQITAVIHSGWLLTCDVFSQNTHQIIFTQNTQPGDNMVRIILVDRAVRTDKKGEKWQALQYYGRKQGFIYFSLC